MLYFITSMLATYFPNQSWHHPDNHDQHEKSKTKSSNNECGQWEHLTFPGHLHKLLYSQQTQQWSAQWREGNTTMECSSRLVLPGCSLPRLWLHSHHTFSGHCTAWLHPRDHPHLHCHGNFVEFCPRFWIYGAIGWVEPTKNFIVIDSVTIHCRPFETSSHAKRHQPSLLFTSLAILTSLTSITW